MLDAIADNTFAILLTFTLFYSCEELCNGRQNCELMQSNGGGFHHNLPGVSV